MNRTPALTVLVVMVLAAVAALVWPRAESEHDEPAASGSAPAEPPVTPDVAPTPELDRRIAAARTRAERGTSWLDWDVVAALHIERADRVGGLEDLGLASEALDRAFALARPGVGPHLRRASLDFRLHRLDDCEAMLEALERHAILLPDERSAAAALRADLAFFRGDYASAREGYTRALEASRDALSLFALARLEWSTGHLESARALLTEAERLDEETRRDSGFLALARATLSREAGDLPAAITHALRAMALQPERIDTILLAAELRLASNELDASEALVRRALERDDGPTTHALAARVARARGDEIAVEEHRQAATRAMESAFARFPEAVAGHALLHFLRFETADRALEMAQANAAARPFGEARARLALALFRAGRVEDARRESELVVASGWRTGESRAIASLIAGRPTPEAAPEISDLLTP